MYKDELAIELRTWEKKSGMFGVRLVDRSDDDEIIDLVISCSGCGAKALSPEELEEAIDNADTLEAFIEVVAKKMEELHESEDEESDDN